MDGSTIIKGQLEIGNQELSHKFPSLDVLALCFRKIKETRTGLNFAPTTESILEPNVISFFRKCLSNARNQQLYNPVMESILIEFKHELSLRREIGRGEESSGEESPMSEDLFYGISSVSSNDSDNILQYYNFGVSREEEEHRKCDMNLEYGRFIRWVADNFKANFHDEFLVVLRKEKDTKEYPNNIITDGDEEWKRVDECRYHILSGFSQEEMRDAFVRRTRIMLQYSRCIWWLAETYEKNLHGEFVSFLKKEKEKGSYPIIPVRNAWGEWGEFGGEFAEANAYPYESVEE